MTALLQHTIRLRDVPEPQAPEVGQYTGEQLKALQILAAPDAIAIVKQARLTSVIATRGDLVAEHVIEGQAHHFYVRDAINAPRLLLERSGVMPASPSHGHALDITLGAYRRMQELVKAGDRRRAEAALLADGVGTASANALIDAVTARRIDVTGLSNDGRRFVGCDLAIVGDETTGRWLVPMDTPASLHVRTLIEPVSTYALLDDLCLVFGDL